MYLFNQVLCASQGWHDIVTVAAPSTESTSDSPAEEDTDRRTRASAAALPVAAVAATVVGEGEFRKLGSTIKNWKQRHYIVLNNGNLRYYDTTDVKSSASAIESKKVKEFCLASVTLEEGSEKNLNASGCADFSTEHGVAITMTSFGMSIKVLELVFDTIQEAKDFVEHVRAVASSHNIEVICVYVVVVLVCITMAA